MIRCDITNPSKTTPRVIHGGRFGNPDRREIHDRPIRLEPGQTVTGAVLGEHTIAMLRNRAAMAGGGDDELRIVEREHVEPPAEPAGVGNAKLSGVAPDAKSPQGKKP